MTARTSAIRRLGWTGPARHDWWPWPLRDRIFVLLACVAVAAAQWSVSASPEWGALLAVLLTSSLAMHGRLALGVGQAVAIVLGSVSGLVMLGVAPRVAGATVLAGLFSIVLIARASAGRKLLRVGSAVGLLAAGVMLSSLLAENALPFAGTAREAIAAGAGGFGSVLLMLALEPLFDALFQHATRRTLTDWLSFEHPLLKELAAKAPGTLQHSVNVGVLAASAASAIRADSLLARVGSLYHDVGKAEAPEYFVENQEGPNPHDDLDPVTSARIIRAHVADGVDRVMAHGMSARVADFVREHHGTGSLRYQRALAEERGLYDPAVSDVFTYPGPRPQTRETGIVMLADQIEATARSAPPADTAACEEIVRRTVARVRAEGELDESGLTVADLSVIERALARSLHSMYHRRLKYPGRRSPSRP